MTTLIEEGYVAVTVSEDLTEITVATPGVQGPVGIGVPTGGTAGQVLAKKSGDDYDTEWQSGGGAGAVSSVNDKTGDVVLYASDIDDFADAADARITAQKGQNSGLATLDSGGKIPSAQLPALAITSTFAVSSQTAQLALAAEEGDVAVRTDLNKSFIKNSGVSGTMTDWQELLTPTDAVLSINGQTGAVTLTTSAISEGNNLYFTNTRAQAAMNGLYESPLTAGTGLARSGNTLSATLSTGVSGGQTAVGGTASGNNLALSSTSHATKGSITFGASSYNENANTLGVGAAASTVNKITVADTALAGSGALAGSLFNMSQTWNTTGTPTAMYLNVTDTASNAAALLFDYRVGGSTQANLTKSGSMTIAGSMNCTNILASSSVRAGQTGLFYWNNSRSTMLSPANGYIRFADSAQTSFTMLQFGGGTSSFPAVKVNGAGLQARLADDSGFANLEVADDAYAAGWDGSNKVPTKNAVYDKVESIGGGWTDYSGTSTITGFSSYTTQGIQYCIIGKTMIVQFDIRGAGNGSTTSFTLPNNASSWGTQVFTVHTLNNNTTQSISYAEIAASSNQVSFSTNGSSSNINGWTTGTTRNINGTIIVNIA